MTEKLPKVLVADDEPAGQALFQVALKKSFELKMVANGQEALDAMAEFAPEVVLLDVNMPVLDGYEVCKRLKETPATRNTAVIFVSGRDSVEERIHGYAVGGDDYITKPFDFKELEAKVAVAVKARQALLQQEQNANMARDVANVAMANAGELGAVLQFLRSMFGCRGYEDVARHLVTAIRSYRLSAAIKIRGILGYYEIGTAGIIKPLESELIDKLYDAGRIHDFGERTIFNYGHVSILIRNMPAQNPDFHGRIRDHAAILAEGADARIDALDLDETIKMQRFALRDVIANTQRAISDVNEVQRALKVKSTSIMEQLLMRVESLYTSLGLSDSQEERLSTVVAEAADQASALYDQDITVSRRLEEIAVRLRKVAEDGQ